MFKISITDMSEKINNWAIANVPWTNVYGLSRSIIAISTALTLLFNDASIFFRPASGVGTSPFCSSTIPSIFCTVPNNYLYLNIVRWICVALLLVIASGWRPRLTGIIHWWIAYSLQTSALTIDGGEQVSAVFTLLMLPITLTDSRKWHWKSNVNQWDPLINKHYIYFRLIALISFVIIRVQVAILYFNSFVAKLTDTDWINGTAVYYYAQNPMLGFPSLLKNIFNFVLTSNLVVIPTWGTLLIQFLLFASLLAPQRYWKFILFTALFMHEIFAVMLGLISFSMVMGAILVLYLRPYKQEFKFSYFKNLYKKVKTSFKRGDATKVA